MPEIAGRGKRRASESTSASATSHAGRGSTSRDVRQDENVFFAQAPACRNSAQRRRMRRADAARASDIGRAIQTQEKPSPGSFRQAVPTVPSVMRNIEG